MDRPTTEPHPRAEHDGLARRARRRCLPVAVATAVLCAGLGVATAAAQDDAAHPDVPADAYFAVPVQTLGQDGVFDGTLCDEGFCPDDTLDRATMAVWTVRVLDGADPAPVTSTRFADVDASHPHAAFIERFADLGITQGCGDGTRFCPDDAVNRAEMAVFLSQAYDLPDGPDPNFSDVPDDAWYAADVARIAASGITQGCGGTQFCPDQHTTRAQMATFLHRAINQSNEATTKVEVSATGESVSALVRSRPLGPRPCPHEPPNSRTYSLTDSVSWSGAEAGDRGHLHTVGSATGGLRGGGDDQRGQIADPSPRHLVPQSQQRTGGPINGLRRRAEFGLRRDPGAGVAPDNRVDLQSDVVAVDALGSLKKRFPSVAVSFRCLQILWY